MSEARYVALLRGINVGGKNLLPMQALAAMFVAAGCSEVVTYIQSGNVVFSASAKVKKALATAISKQIEADFGLRVPIVLRSTAEMIAVAEGNPFLLQGFVVETLYVSFLQEMPSGAALAGLDAQRSPGDQFEVVGGEIYMQLGNGAGNTKLTNAYFDSKLKTVSTSRNWRTVLKLVEMLAG